MPRSDPIQGITTPLGTETPDGAAMGASIVDQLVVKSVMWFATTTTRDAAIASGARKAGMLCYVDSLGYWYGVKVNAGPWVKVTADLFNGTETAWIGSNPPAGTPRIRQEFSTVAVGNAGAVVINFPTTFPNGIMSAVVTPGDTSANFAYFVNVTSGTSGANLFGIPYNTSNAILGVGQGFRANVIAVGW